MHLLSVNVEFDYEPIYALGVVTTFRQFMQGYRPEEDVTSIFKSLCEAIQGSSADKYSEDAENLKVQASQLSLEDLKQILENVDNSTEQIGVHKCLSDIAQASNYKYSRLFAIGLLTILELIDDSVLANEEKLSEWLNKLCETLGLSQEKVSKDVELYRSNLDKLRQAQEVLADVLKADRKKQQEREATKTETSDGDDESAAASDAAPASNDSSEKESAAPSSDEA